MTHTYEVDVLFSSGRLEHFEVRTSKEHMEKQALYLSSPNPDTMLRFVTVSGARVVLSPSQVAMFSFLHQGDEDEAG